MHIWNRVDGNLPSPKSDYGSSIRSSYLRHGIRLPPAIVGCFLHVLSYDTYTQHEVDRNNGMTQASSGNACKGSASHDDHQRRTKCTRRLDARSSLAQQSPTIATRINHFVMPKEGATTASLLLETMKEDIVRAPATLTIGERGCNVRNSDSLDAGVIRPSSATHDRQSRDLNRQ